MNHEYLQIRYNQWLKYHTSPNTYRAAVNSLMLGADSIGLLSKDLHERWVYGKWDPSRIITDAEVKEIADRVAQVLAIG